MSTTIMDQPMTSILQLPPAKTRVSYLRGVAISRAYAKGQVQVPVLRGVDLCVGKGEFVSIVGKSGCGKSTLMHLFGLLDTPDSGEVRLEQNRIDDLPATTRDQLRNRMFGFVFQFYHLLPEMTLLENVLAPLMIRYSAWEYWRRRHEFRDQARAIIHKMGLEHRLKHRPSELSGGEMQRAAIARALIGKPEVLLADEPTGNLDAVTGREIMAMMTRLNEEEGLTIIMVTHDETIARQANRIVRLTEGRIQGLEEAA